jgi:DNA-binding transcriptional LysR family regulator
VDLRHLVTFCAVVDRGSFSAAADELGISQPAVSVQIRSLEERLGQRLLDRNGRSVALTEAGRVLEAHARRMIALETELEREMGEVGERIAGRLQLGSSTGPGEVLLPRLLGRFRATHPDVTVSLVVHDTQTICDRVLDGEMELGIVGAARPQRGLEYVPFLRDELVVIVPPDHSLAARATIGLDELSRLPLLMQQRGSGVRAVLEEAFRTAGIRLQDLQVAMELGLQQSVKSAVLDGLGLTVMSRLTVAPELTDGRLVALAIDGHELARDFSVVRAAGRTPTRLTTAFLDFATAELDKNT